MKSRRCINFPFSVVASPGSCLSLALVMAGMTTLPVQAATLTAANAPVTVNLGGSVDFLAAVYAQSNRGQQAGIESDHHDFEALYDLDFGISGKAGSLFDYGAKLGLGDGPDISNFLNGNSDVPFFNTGYVWLSGDIGKAQLGDSRGATDLMVGAPVIGEGQVLGRYMDFLDTATFAKNLVYGVDGLDHSTNITYYTPKFGNDSHKVQFGFSYIPEFYNYGGSAVTYDTGRDQFGSFGNNFSPYQDVVKAAAVYTGKIAPVAVSASAEFFNGTSNDTGAAPGSATNARWIYNAPAGAAQDFTAWGVGAQAAWAGFTLGGGYLDQGHYDTVVTQNKAQDQYTAALKYEFNKLSVGVSYLGAKGYGNLLATGASPSANADNYIKDFTSYGAGGAFTWAPGFTSNLDGIYFDQKSDTGIENEGYVLLISQKLAF